MVIRTLLGLVLGLAACGGSSKPSTVDNKGGTTGSATETPVITGEARVVQRTQNGGVVELAGNRADAMERASKEMVAHCGPGNYTITQEGEESVGGEDGTGSGELTTAWRVYYSCSGAPAAP